jgi:hypothetical protein
VTTDELARAYRIWREVGYVEDLIAGYRQHIGPVQISIPQEADRGPICETTIHMDFIGYAIIEALEQRLASYRYELSELG